ncbi:MAG: SH3 domain-containing protein [Anaerolineae bacterium]
MRILAAIVIVLLGVSGVSAALAQPAGMNSSVIINVVTSADGTNDNLSFTLSGTFPGDPYTVTLDQPGDLQPGMSNSYNFVVPHTFCEMFQFELRLDGGDSWQGTQMSIMIDSIEVWFNGAFADGSPLTGSNWRGGTWDGTDAYRSRCPMTPVNLSFITGANGTADNPFFDIEGDFSASPYRYTVNQPGDLQPGQIDTYEYLVPMDFCQMTGWALDKPATAGIDDDWLPNEIDISVDSTLVYFDAVFHEVGPITADSNVSGTWDGTDAYHSRCAGGDVIVIPGLVLTPIIVPPGGLQVVTPVQINPNIIVQPFASATPIPFDAGNLQILPTPTSPNAGVSQCEGAPPSRLSVGGMGRVTPGAPNRLRAQPGTSAAVIGNIPAGATFQVLAGPTCANGYAWWQVNYGGVVGWTAEGSGAQYWIEPL